MAIVAAMVCCFERLVGQSGTGFIEFAGKVVEARNSEPLPFAVIEVLDSNRIVDRSMTDFDGGFNVGFCGRDCFGTDIMVKVIPFGSPVREYRLPCRVDTALVFSVAEGIEEKSALDKDSLDRFVLHYFPRGNERYPCGQAFLEADPWYRNCEGVAKRYSELAAMKVRWVEWKMVEE